MTWQADGAGTGVLVAVDGSAAALGAARWAALYARAHGRPLTIGCALQLPVPGGEAGTARMDFLEALRSRSERALERARQAARSVLGPDGPITGCLWESPPIPAVLEAGGSADIVVLGHRGLGEAPEPAAGSVASALIAYGTRPVAVVRDWGASEPGLGDGPVVVGVDGSRHGERALAFAIEEARVRGAQLHVVHAWSDTPLIGLDDARLQWESVGQREDAVLAEALAGWRGRYPDVRIVREVVHDRPVRHLVRSAGSAQLLVVGSRGRGGFTGMMVGSTSRALLHSAPCPLVVVRDAAADSVDSVDSAAGERPAG